MLSEATVGFILRRWFDADANTYMRFATNLALQAYEREYLVRSISRANGQPAAKLNEVGREDFWARLRALLSPHELPRLENETIFTVITEFFRACPQEYTRVLVDSSLHGKEQRSLIQAAPATSLHNIVLGMEEPMRSALLTKLREAMSCLLRLPAEIRLRVYEYVLREFDEIEWNLALLRTCRLIRRELLVELGRMPIHIQTRPGWASLWNITSLPIPLVELRTLHIRMYSVEVNWHLDGLQGVESGPSNLEKLLAMLRGLRYFHLVLYCPLLRVLNDGDAVRSPDVHAYQHVLQGCLEGASHLWAGSVLLSCADHNLRVVKHQGEACEAVPDWPIHLPFMKTDLTLSPPRHARVSW